MNIQRVEEGHFDEITVATGSTPIVPKVNLRKKNVVRFVKDVFKNPEGTGKDVIILGGVGRY